MFYPRNRRTSFDIIFPAGIHVVHLKKKNIQKKSSILKRFLTEKRVCSHVIRFLDTAAVIRFVHDLSPNHAK